MYEILEALNDIDDDLILCYDFCGVKRRKRRIRHAVLAAAAVLTAAVTGAIGFFGITGGKGNEPQQGGIAVLDVTETDADTESEQTVAGEIVDGVKTPSNYEFEAVGEARLDMRGTDYSQEKSIELYQKLMKYYGVYDSTDPYPHYDDNFGGAFISVPEEGYLVIFLCDTSDEEIEKIREAIGDSGYIIAPVFYSYNTLIDTVKQLNRFLPSLLDEGIRISCIYEDVKSNRVVVGIEDCDDNDIATIKKYVDRPFVIFKDIKREYEASTSIRGGHN